MLPGNPEVLVIFRSASRDFFVVVINHFNGVEISAFVVEEFRVRRVNRFAYLSSN